MNTSNAEGSGSSESATVVGDIPDEDVDWSDEDSGDDSEGYTSDEMVEYFRSECHSLEYTDSTHFVTFSVA